MGVVVMIPFIVITEEDGSEVLINPVYVIAIGKHQRDSGFLTEQDEPLLEDFMQIVLRDDISYTVRWEEGQRLWDLLRVPVMPFIGRAPTLYGPG